MITPRPIADRFWAKVDKRGPNECWPWLGNATRGYGRIGRGPASAGAAATHRLSWELHNGPIPVGMCVLHRCDNPPCVNPAHLFIGTVADNTRDMIAKGRGSNQRKTHCPQGHEYTPENTSVRSHGGRDCRECARVSARAGKRRKRVETGYRQEWRKALTANAPRNGRGQFASAAQGNDQ